ncbi:MAG: serine--tRNA ligase [Thermoplasmata archaeon]
MVCSLRFSGVVEDKKENILSILEGADKDLLKKGVPKGMEGGASIENIEFFSDRIRLILVSDRYVRAHDAVFRLKKKLSQKMGKKFHVGVRGIDILSYDVEFKCDDEPVEPVDIPFVDHIEFKGNLCRLNITDLTQEQLENNYVDRIIKRVMEKVNAQYYRGKGEQWKLLWSSERKEVVWKKDPTVEMEKKGWIMKGPTKGKWFYRPQAAKILRTMKNIALQEVLEPLGFQEIIESLMVPFDVWIDTGHMEGVPNEMYYVSEPVTRDPLEWEQFVDHVKIAREVPEELLAKLVSKPKSGVCYAQCPVVYWSLRNQTIADESLPLLVYDRTVPSARYESGGRHGIERVDEFHRIEPVYVGTKEQLVDLKERMIRRYNYVFEEILELEWRMAEVEPFYLQQSGSSESKEGVEEGTIDFEAYLPYRGSREENEWLEFQNLSIFRKYTKAFNIKSQTKELYSGCSGIGLERWTTAFLAQKGIELSNWPEKFRELYGESPKGLKLL